MTLSVDFGTGAGNYESNLPLMELIKVVNKELSFTQKPVKISGPDGVVAVLRWWDGTAASLFVTSSFGDFGYYGAWQIVNKDYPWITESFIEQGGVLNECEQD